MGSKAPIATLGNVRIGPNGEITVTGLRQDLPPHDFLGFHRNEEVALLAASKCETMNEPWPEGPDRCHLSGRCQSCRDWAEQVVLGSKVALALDKPD